MQPSELEILLADFGDISRRASEVRDRRDKADGSKRDPNESMAYAMALHDLRFVDGGLVWYDGAEGFMPEVPIGKPEDYIPIRDNFDALKEFIAKTLDRGRLRAGGGTHGDTSRDTNTAEYVAWIYVNSQYPLFRGNGERATVELLRDELRREFKPINLEPALREEEQRYTRYYKGDFNEFIRTFLSRDQLSTALWRLGLDSAYSPKDLRIKNEFVIEVKKTERPITLDEVLGKYGGTQESLREMYQNGRFKDVVEAHFLEIPDELKTRMKDWHIRNQAQKAAVREFAPQFNRLVGLLDVVSYVGKPDNGFVEAYGDLAQRAREGFMRDAPTLQYEFSGANIYHSILLALSKIQRSDELRDLWLQNIREDSRTERVIVSVHGLFSAYKTNKGRREQIPAVLAKLQEREYDLDQTRQYPTAIGFLDDVNLLDNVVQHLVQMSYGRGRFTHLDKESTSLDVLSRKHTGDGKYDFVFVRYTPAGKQVLKSTYDLRTDTLEGDAQLEKTVRAYFEGGYEIGNKVKVTSLEGRRIAGTEAKIVENGEQNVDGFYEGLVGLNHTPFPFLYNATNGVILLAEPFDSRTVMFGMRGGWAERRAGLEKVTAKVPYDKFQPISQFAQRVNELVQERKRHGYLGDALYNLDGKLSGELATPLSLVISSRLINARDGLVQ